MSDSTDPQAEPAASPAEEKSLDQLLVEALARIEEQKDARLRAVAEVENVRKRAQADVAAAHKFAVERMAESLVPVMDSLEAALNAAQDAPQANAGVALKALRDGVELTLKQLQAALQKASITDIAPAVGERFDPHMHQAIAAVDAAGAPANSIVAVMLKGYRLHDRILRPALVTVAQALENREGNPISNSNLNTN
jgi:molecular chaperone GrpE